MKLLTTSNAKITKSNKKLEKYLGAILHLAPANISGHEVCPNRSKQCFATCLFTAGRGRFDNVKNGRIRKTKMLFENPEEFSSQLVNDLDYLVRKSKKDSKKICVRINGTSDLDIDEKFPKLFEKYPNFQFYDYTKDEDKFRRYMNKELSKNYYLILSRSEDNWDFCKEVLDKGFNVAVVFQEIPKKYMGYKVIDGDEHDFRFLERHTGRIVGLKAKGYAKKLPVGQFVV